MVLSIDKHIQVPDTELALSFVRSSGPGGQNVNKVASKAVLRWNAAASTALPPDVRQRFLTRYASRLTAEGEVVLSSQRYRDQGRNLADVREKLRAMIATVAAAPKKRRATRPTLASKKRRIEDKQARARTKRLRGNVAED